MDRIFSFSVLNASCDLIQAINHILATFKITLKDNVQNIAFLTGPGSFTTSRIVCATVLGLKTAINMNVWPVSLDEAVNALPDYTGSAICLRCNSKLWYFFYNTWSVTENIPPLNCKYISNQEIPGVNLLQWPDIGRGIVNFVLTKPDKTNIEPLYII